MHNPNARQQNQQLAAASSLERDFGLAMTMEKKRDVSVSANLRQTGGHVRQTVMVKWRLRNTLQSSFHIGSGNGGRALEKDDPDEIKRFGAKHRIGGGDDWRSAPHRGNFAYLNALS